MWFKKKEIKTENKEDKLISLVNESLTKYEKPFIIDFNKWENDFSFTGSSYSYYNKKQSFSFAEERSLKAITDLKSSIVYLKNEFTSQGVDNRIVFSKLKELEKFEIFFQEKIKKEKILIQTENIDGILLSTVEIFQTFSRDYLNLVMNIKKEILNFINKNFVAIDLVNEFSKILKEQENILPKELTDYKLNLNGYSVIYNLENFIRVLIITNFRGIPLKQYLSSEHKKYIQEQKEKEKENRWCDERQGGDLFYLTLSQLIEIIKNNKENFKNKDILISKIEDPLNKIIVIRNKLAHNILITKDDLDCIKMNNNIVLKYLRKQKDDVINYKFNKKKV